MQTALEILKKYWGFDAFKSPQNDIIDSVLAGNDTFGLLPTGGGKSICYQVPALMSEGICIVISPLIALMKDQIQQLEKRNIKAIALTGGISTDELINLLDNCEFGNYKLVYLSPERLQSDWIMERLIKLPVNLIAIDEAHCVSQWGHDFRPAYLKISALKKHFPKVPFLALTATATEIVVQDVIFHLDLKQPKVFRKSFERKNIAFMVFDIEDKLFRIQQILNKNPEPSIIYVRNRKSCSEMASQLESLGFTSTFYHGGLSAKEKTKNMNLWMNEEVQVIVATNAFGMGIDKPNVKTVIHTQLPESMESYYQEAGRAGRNEEKAFAVILANTNDIFKAQHQFITNLPDKKLLNQVYIKLCSHFRIAYGEGIHEQFSFDLNQFCQKYGLPVISTFQAFQFLDRQGVLSVSQEFSEKIFIQFIIPSKEVIRYISLNPNEESVILSLIRNYAGIYEIQTVVNVSLIAKKSNQDESFVLSVLEKLKNRSIIDYHKKNNDTTIVFNEIREDERTIHRISKYLEIQNKQKVIQFESVLHYIKDTKNCKNSLILHYFGESSTSDCGICSFCISKTKPNETVELVSKKIEAVLKEQELNSREIHLLTKIKENEIIFALQTLLENNKIVLQPNNKYLLK